MLCVHCKENDANRPRGLCWSCYYQPQVQLLYNRRKNGHCGPENYPDDFNGPGKTPDAPTEAWPGSGEKIEIMRERAARGQGIFHPLDRGTRSIIHGGRV